MLFSNCKMLWVYMILDMFNNMWWIQVFFQKNIVSEDYLNNIRESLIYKGINSIWLIQIFSWRNYSILKLNFAFHGMSN